MSATSDRTSALGAKRVRTDLRRRQQRAALTRVGDAHARSDELLEEFSKRLCEHLLGVKVAPERILAIGPGPQSWFSALRERFGSAPLVAGSPSAAQLAANRSRWPWRRRPAVTLYPDALPFADGSFGLVVVNLLGSEPSQLPGLIAEAARVLQTGGLICASFLGPDSFKEFASAWQHVDSSPHVIALTDMHDIGDLLPPRGFVDIVVDAERLQLTYADPRAAIAEARALGIGNVHPHRARGLTGRAAWQRFLAACPTLEGRTPVTLELIYVHAWKSAPPGTVEVNLI